MIFRVHKPVQPLDQFVELFIYFEQAEAKHSFDRFLPTGDAEILIDLNEGPQHIYDNETLAEIQTCKRVWASGVRTRPITIPSGNGSAMMVISLKKGMAFPFFPFPMDEIRDRVVDADLIWGLSFNGVRDRLLAEKDIDKKFSLLESFLLETFGSRFYVNSCVSFALDEMIRNPDKLSIARMNQKIGYSQKHFTDIFKRHVGVTPKAYLKIMRFQKAVGMIDAASATDWRSIAYECGFYDQAHFINDFKHFCGFTPDQYAQIHLNYQNYIPVG